MDKNYINILNSWKQLVNDIIACPNYKNNILLVITGDVFEFKTHLNSDDVHIFYELIMQLEVNQIRTVIIPGNHDYNINSKCAQDNISILLGQEWSTSTIPNIQNRAHTLDGQFMSPLWKYVHCYPKTGIYTIDNIQFYVHSPIDKVIPQILNVDGKVKIALLHEPVISAQYDNNELIFNGRFKQNDFAAYDIVMMGDIHRPQFLAPNMAYAGSFVQKNRGEGLNHGYILWNIGTRTGQHYWIPLKEIALKIVARDNNFVAPLPDIVAEITYLGFIYKDCSADWLKGAASLIRDKYKRPINQIIRNDTTQKMNIDIANTLQMDTSKFTHANLIIQMLNKSKTSEHMIKRVLDYHNQFLQNRQLCPTVRYYIKYLSWSNVFCYGLDNFVNFEELNGLVALAGKNKSGKSSIIDILIRILFNECERGHKDDIINKHAKSAYIKCCFRIVNDEYIIEQSWQQYTSAATFHLYKNKEDITKDTLIKTYKYMREDLGLGNYKDFVNLTTALQNRKFIIDLDKKEIYSLLCKLLDIDTMRDIEEHVKKERDFIKRQKKIHLKELDNLGPITNREEVWEKEIQRIELRYQEDLAKKINYEDQLTFIRDQVCQLNRQIQHIDLPHDWVPHEVSRIELPYSVDEYLEIIYALEKLKIEFGINKEKLLQFDKAKIKQLKMDGMHGIETFDQLLLNELEPLTHLKLWNIEKFRTQYSYEELEQFPVCEVNIDELYRQLIPCEQSKIINIIKPPSDLATLTQQLNEYQDAKQNLAIYKAQRTLAYEILQGFKIVEQPGPLGVNFLENTYDKYRNQYSLAKHASRININELKSSIQQWHEYNQIISNNHTLEHNQHIEAKITEYNIYLNVKHDILQHQRTKDNNNINHAQYIWKQHLNHLYVNEYLQVRELVLDLKNQVDVLKIKISKYDDAKMQQTDYAAYDDNVSKYNQSQLNITLDIEIAKLKSAETKLLVDIKQLDKNISGFSTNIENIKKVSVRCSEIVNKITELDDTLNLYDTYYGCINHKTGIPSNLLRQVCSVLSERCNDILNNITDFNVEFVFDDEIKIYTIAKGANDTNMKLSASLGSGFQKFLLDMIMRIVLTRISNISNPNILFVDEGFGCLDKDNFSNVCSCLMKLKSNFDAMIVITHIPELQSYMDQILEVNTENGTSQLRFGQLTIDEYDLSENANLRIIKQSVENAKELAPIKKVSKSATDKNPEIIMSSTIQKADAEPGKLALSTCNVETKTADPLNGGAVSVKIVNNRNEQSMWSAHPELLAHLNTNEQDIYSTIQGFMVPFIDNKYTCYPCQKSFKRRDQVHAHINAKTYKTKHYKFLAA